MFWFFCNTSQHRSTLQIVDGLKPFWCTYNNHLTFTLIKSSIDTQVQTILYKVTDRLNDRVPFLLLFSIKERKKDLKYIFRDTSLKSSRDTLNLCEDYISHISYCFELLFVISGWQWKRSYVDISLTYTLLVYKYHLKSSQIFFSTE